MQNVELKGIYIHCRICSSSYTEHNKIGFAIFGFLYDFILNLQGTVKTLEEWRHFMHPAPDGFKSSQMCPRPSPPYPDGGGRACRRWGGPEDANKRAVSSIGLTRGRLATETQPGNDPVIAGGGQPRHLRDGEVPGECEGELSHRWSGRLWWRFGEGARGSVGTENKRKSRLITTALMATAAGGVFSGARMEETRRVFRGQERRKQLRVSVVPTGTTAWVPRRLAMCGGALASGG
jgi:hypothetical protein